MDVAIAIAGNLRHVGVVRLRAAPQEQRRFAPRMAVEEARKFEAGVSSRAEHRGFKFCRHQYVLCRFPVPSAMITLLVEAYLSIIMHKYSSIVNDLATVSSRKRDSRAWEGCGVTRRGKPASAKGIAPRGTRRSGI